MKQILGAAWAATLAFVLSLVTPMQAQRGPQIPGFVPDPTNPGRGLILAQRSEFGSVVTFARAQGRGIAAGAQTRAAIRAQSFLTAHGSEFGLPEAATVRLLDESSPDQVGVQHVRFQQLHRGVPVTAGQLLVHLNDDFVVAANSEVLVDPQIDVTPDLPAVEAVEKARALIQRLHDATTAADVTYSAPRLEVLNRGLLEPGSYPTRLTWFIEAKALAVREFIWVDALTGGIALHFNQLTTAKNRRIYDAQNDSTLPGVLVRSEGGPATGDTDADAAYTYSGDTYDYFLTQHGRDSFDNAGGTLISTVHYCEIFFCFFGPFQNAFWNGTQMVYGEGFASADDVDAHELTHAVTERTAGLFYYLQSGALNESFSDIFGETVDLTNGHGNDAPSVRWKLGEELPASVGIIRDMMTPTLYGDPGKMSDPQFSTAYDYNADQGGVHTNSGVPNHGYALMVDGGTYNGKTITGIGLTAAAKIQYRALTVYLTSGANFLDDYNALQQACTDLIGVSGITATTCVQVKNALDAVELNGIWPGNTQPPAFCSAGQTRTDLFFDNFETAVNPNWSTAALQGTGTWNVPDTGWSKSGVRMAWGPGFDTRVDTVMSMNNGVAVPAGAKMQFSHAFSFEQANGIPYDGGVLEYSTNGGATWIDAGSLIVAGAPYYTTPISLNDMNPLAGRYAFARNSYGYTATQLNLSPLAGSTVRFRFRVGTDPAVGDIGWVVDDVRLYTCGSGSCTYSISPTSGSFTAAGGNGSVNVTASSGTCGWTAESSVGWITITGGANGSGNGTVTYSVAANTLSTPRSATLTIAGQTFTVNQAAANLAVTVTTPNGGERLYTGTPYLVTWTAAGAASFDVAFSTDGVTFNTITGCSNLPAAARSCTWSAPGPVTTNGRIRVVAHDSGAGTLSDVSDSKFTVLSGTANITVTYPNSAVNLGIGSMQQIKWSHNLGTQSYVRIELSRDNGATYPEVLATAFKNTTASGGTFDWRVTGPATAGAGALIRITWTSAATADVSNVAFTIATAFISLTAPATNSNWGFGTTHKQVWTTNLGPLDRVNVQLSTTGIGGAYSTMSGGANIVATTKTANVVTPSTATTTARIKIVWANPPTGSSASGDNPGNFTLAPAFVTITAPTAGTLWSLGSSKTITWNNNLGTAEQVEIRLSKDNGSTYPTVIVASTPSDGKHGVTVDPSWGSQATTRVKVTSISNPTVKSESASFTIQ